MIRSFFYVLVAACIFVFPAFAQVSNQSNVYVSAVVPTPFPSIINFSGRAYPGSTVTVLQDGQIVATTISGSDATFQLSLSDLVAGTYAFTFYSEDDQGRRSSLYTFAATVSSGTTTNISGIFLSPTINTDRAEIRKGEFLAIFGQTVPNGIVTIEVNPDDYFIQTTADGDGIYSYSFDTTPLLLGAYTIRSQTSVSGEVSNASLVVDFEVGALTVPTGDDCGMADLNCDGRVNLVDFSIAAYWYRRDINSDFSQIEANRLNGDGEIDIVDFSIMAYYWTG